MLFQINDATQAVKQIGFAAALALFLILAVAWVGRFLVKYFVDRLDKKDAQIVVLNEERREDLSRMVRSQNEMVESQHAATRGQEKIADALETLANEIRRPRR